MRAVAKFGISLSTLAVAGIFAIGGIVACARETKNPQVRIHVVETSPRTASVPAPEDSKPTQADTVQPDEAGTAKAQVAGVRPVSWALVNEKVIAPRCAACHSGTKPSAGLSLTTAAEFKEAAPNIFAFVFYPPVPEAKMPLGGDLTAEQKQVLGDYMVDGLLP